MIKNDQSDVLSFGSNMGCYLSLSLLYLEVACDVVHLSKKVNELRMNSYMLYDTYDIHVMLMPLYFMIKSIVA